jgi:hypothetical protein
MAQPAALALLCVVLIACAEEAQPLQGLSEEPATATSDVSPAIEEPILLGRLPRSGFVVGTERSAVFLDLAGRELDEVPGLGLAGNPGAPGVWLERHKDVFRLDADRGILMPVPRTTAEGQMYEEGEQPQLPIPSEAPRVNGDLVGHWRFAYRAPSGAVLAQWSGECEVPTAYWIDESSAPRIITGESDQGSAPESIALGWSDDGRAFAHLGDGLCGNGGDPPGIYAFRSPGEAELLYPTRLYSRVEMWHR